jgi:hypothetical protein
MLKKGDKKESVILTGSTGGSKNLVANSGVSTTPACGYYPFYHV